jgi:hypothetical protein
VDEIGLDGLDKKAVRGILRSLSAPLCFFAQLSTGAAGRWRWWCVWYVGGLTALMSTARTIEMREPLDDHLSRSLPREILGFKSWEVGWAISK